MAAVPLFHLAFPVHDLSVARRFYGELIGCREGRSSDSWVDFDFYGHQIVAHLAPEEARALVAMPGGLRTLDVPLLVSHLGSATEPGEGRNPQQLARFRDIRALFPESRASLAYVLEKRGEIVHQAANGRAALAVARREKLHALILDL